MAFGRRIAWLLRGEEFSLGAYPALYIHFTPTLALGEIEVTDDGGDWWQRYTNVGVPSDFLAASNSSEFVRFATLAVLKTIRPDRCSEIDNAANLVMGLGDDLRFLVKSHNARRFLVEISTNISVWPRPSQLTIALTNRSSGSYFEAEPLPLAYYAEAFHLAGSIRVSDSSVVVLPNKSVSAQFSSAHHGGAIERPIASFQLKSRRPTLSRLLKRRG